MPKMKTNSAAKKRFRKNKNGVIKRGCQYAGHKMTNKTSKRKTKWTTRSLEKSSSVTRGTRSLEKRR